LGCDEQSLDARPYLAADLSKSHHFREQLGISDKPCIGIVWRAGALDTSRSVPLEWLLNCAARLSPAVQLVSLQREVEASEKTLLQQYGCIEAGTRFLDFDDTAAAIAALDATITVDTAVAHLAGALGFPTYLLLNEPADVRWMVDRKDTPWYSRMHLLRKNAQEHWQPMLTQALKLAAKSRSDHSQAGLRPTITY
jgi:ADP-heptose:LPS heptosyltransferase